MKTEPQQETKTFLIINGKDIFIRKFESISNAITFAQNYMNQSLRVQVLEIDKIDINIKF
ncbi:hypothetical protein [Flavobacterium sp.]|uniref:hypothetical protein n=1 Tax=Flavobacterium sp. TaxID=239 RepID=UPI00333FCE7B